MRFENGAVSEFLTMLGCRQNDFCKTGSSAAAITRILRKETASRRDFDAFRQHINGATQ
jgi:hypothetical protein